MKYAFAGNREISVKILKFLISQGYSPKALFTTEGKNDSHSNELIHLSDLDSDYIFSGIDFKKNQNIEKLKKLDLDYIFGIHFPYIIPEEVLSIPKIGFLNLHPAFLPFNKGWHTPSWAILDKTPFGATLHFMTKELDAGDIIHQKQIKIKPDDTANSLYLRTLQLEYEVFQEAFPDLLTLNPSRKTQSETGTSKNKKDLAKIQEINLSESYKAEDLIDKLRALTTNNIEEAAFIKKEGKKIAITITLTELKN